MSDISGKPTGVDVLEVSLAGVAGAHPAGRAHRVIRRPDATRTRRPALDATTPDLDRNYSATGLDGAHHRWLRRRLHRVLAVALPAPDTDMMMLNVNSVARASIRELLAPRDQCDRAGQGSQCALHG